ncbi:hypothetical protein AVEN_194519-1 [Araneus ventricosus]|uniref:Reverse transcriptase domain-containing protein n=1 Tax=Araneus ventricosus TaxID=182803 RepID=A0A4Y2A6A1_ARAVE|nr:hypothetical protein AVEN_194519-1 [Araneus ventricosus]
MLVDTGANVTLLRTDLTEKLKEQLIYTALNISLKTATGEKQKYEANWMHPLNASPLVLVKKKDGSTRFCVDYRKLDEITKKDSYPLPRRDDTLDALNGSRWFMTLDLKSGYWQVEIRPEDREKRQP